MLVVRPCTWKLAERRWRHNRLRWCLQAASFRSPPTQTPYDSGTYKLLRTKFVTLDCDPRTNRGADEAQRWAFWQKRCGFFSVLCAYACPSVAKERKLPQWNSTCPPRPRTSLAECSFHYKLRKEAMERHHQARGSRGESNSCCRRRRLACSSSPHSVHLACFSSARYRKLIPPLFSGGFSSECSLAVDSTTSVPKQASTSGIPTWKATTNSRAARFGLRMGSTTIQTPSRLDGWLVLHLLLLLLLLVQTCSTHWYLFLLLIGKSKCFWW